VKRRHPPPKTLARLRGWPQNCSIMARKPLTPDQTSWLAGQMLIAMPKMQDPRFAQSVIFMCAHTAEGAMGIVLNRPLAKPRFAEVLEQLEIEPVPPARDIRMGAGGPVDGSRGFVLHTADWRTDGSMDVQDGYVLTASLDVLRAIAEGGGPAQAFFAMGYTGWDAKQLDEEILQNAWLSVPPDEAIVFDADFRTKWTRALAKLRIDPAKLSPEAGRA
jgi:putative transcriptional regulator